MLLPICRWIFTLICLRSEPDFTVLLHSCAPFVFLPPNGPGFLSSKPSSLVVMVMVMEVVWSLFSFFVLRLSLSFSLKKDIHD